MCKVFAHGSSCFFKYRDSGEGGPAVVMGGAEVALLRGHRATGWRIFEPVFGGYEIVR